MSATLWTVLTIIAALGAGGCLYLMHVRVNTALKAIDKDFRLPDMRFKYTPQELYACFDGVGKDGQKLLKRYWLTDFGFIACFWFVMVAIGRSNVYIDWLRAAMLIAASLRALMDILENLLLLSVNAAYPERRKDGLARLSGYVTSAKFTALGLWIAGMFGALFISALKMGR